MGLKDGASVGKLCTYKRADYGNIRKEGHLTDGSLLRSLIFTEGTTSSVVFKRAPRCIQTSTVSVGVCRDERRLLGTYRRAMLGRVREVGGDRR